MRITLTMTWRRCAPYVNDLRVRTADFFEEEETLFLGLGRTLLPAKL